MAVDFPGPYHPHPDPGGRRWQPWHHPSSVALAWSHDDGQLMYAWWPPSEAWLICSLSGRAQVHTPLSVSLLGTPAQPCRKTPNEQVTDRHPIHHPCLCLSFHLGLSNLMFQVDIKAICEAICWDHTSVHRAPGSSPCIGLVSTVPVVVPPTFEAVRHQRQLPAPHPHAEINTTASH